MELPELVQRLTFKAEGYEDANKAVEGLATLGKALDDLQSQLDQGMDISKGLGSLRAALSMAGSDISGFARGASDALSQIDASGAEAEIGGLGEAMRRAGIDMQSALGDMHLMVNPEIKDMGPEAQDEAAEIQAIFARLEEQLTLNPDMETDLVEKAMLEINRIANNGASRTVEEVNENLSHISVDTSRLERDIQSAGRMISSGLTSAAEQAADGMTSVLGGLGQMATGAVTATSLALGATMAKSLYGGFQRFSTIQDARSLFETLLGSESQAQAVMDDIVDVVTGTPFPLDQFAQLGSTMVSLNVDAAKVPGYLNAIGEAAASQGGRATQVAEVLGNAFGEMATFGRVTGDTLWSLQQAGVPATTILANAFKTSTIEMRDMVSQGMVPAGKAMDVLAKGIVEGSTGVAGTVKALGGSMAKLNQNLSGALANMGAAMNRFGASIIGKLEPVLTAGLGAIIKVFDGLGAVFSRVIGNIANAPALQGIVDWLSQIANTSTTDMVVKLTSALDKFGSGLAPIAAAFASFGAINIAQFLGPFQGLANFLPGPFVSAMAAVILTNEDMRASLVETGQTIGSALAPVMPKVSQAIGEIATALAELVTALGPAIGDLAEFAASLIEGVLPAVGPITDALGVLADILGAIPAPALAAIAAFAGFGKLGTMFGNAGTAVSGFAEKLSGMGTLGTKVGAGVSAIGSKLSSLSANMGVWGAAASAAIGVAMFAWDAWTEKTRVAEQRSRELAAALYDQVKATIESGEAASSASVGMDALSTTLTTTGDEGDKLRNALGMLGQDADTAGDTLVKMGESAEARVATLADLAKSAGLSGDAAQRLAEMVKYTDDNFSSISTSDGQFALELEEIASQAGMTTDELLGIAQNMEQVDDAFENFKPQIVYKDFIETAAGADAASRSLLELAEQNSHTSRTAEDLAPLYFELTRLMDENTDAQNVLHGASKTTEEDLKLLAQANPNLAAAINDTTVATTENTDAVAQQARKSLLAAVAAGTLTDEEATQYQQRLKLASTSADYQSIIDELAASEEAAAEQARANAQAVGEVAKNFDEAEVAASAYGDTLDKLSGRTVGAEEAMLSFQSGLDDLAASTEDQIDAMMTQGELTTEGKQGFLDYLQSISDATQANILNGDSAEEASAKAKWQYESLLGVYDQLGANTDSLRAYADQMNLTPEEITSVVKMLGIKTETEAIRTMLGQLQGIKPEYIARVETLLDKGKLTQAYRAMDRFGIPITKEVVAKAMGIKDADKQLTGLTKKKLVAIIQSQTPNVKENESKLMALSKKKLVAMINTETPDIDKDDDKLTRVADKERKAKIHSETPDADKNMKDLDRVADKKRTAKVESTTPNADSNSRTLDNVARTRTANINVAVNGASQAEQTLNNLSRDRTTTNTIRQVVVPAPGRQEGGPVWANRMYTVGEKGPELFVPSQSGQVMPTNHPMTKLAAKLGTLRFVEPKRNAPVGVPSMAPLVGATRVSPRNLSIGNMVINQDLDLEVALTRIGMAMSESTL